MGERYNFWNHGITLQVQYEDKVESIFRGGAGAQIKQNSGGNWFQMPIPSPTVLEEKPALVRHAFLRGEINGQAKITRVHLWHGGKPRGRIIWKNDNLSISSRPFDENFNIADQACSDPMAMSIWVEFKRGGEIWFAGAGVSFWKP